MLLLLLAYPPLYAQQPVEDLKQQFAAFQQLAPQEKLFVHTDKNFYLTGETIWFKLYHVDAGSHKTSDISKVAYVEILNHEAKPVMQVKVGLHVNNGSGDGSFILPAHLASGTYQLRAYTQWMKNFDASYYFNKTLSIVNTSVRPDWLSLEKREAYHVQFFPEGGNLVYGLQSRIGFKITDQYGKGVEGNGVIIDQKNNATRFYTSRFGIGSFSFLPVAGSDYKVSVTLNNGKMFTASLPAVYKEGYVMNVSEVDKDRVRITATSTNNANTILYLLGHTRQQVKVALGERINNGKAEWTINKDQLGEGVSHFTLFNENRQPVCERLYFRRPVSKLNIGVTAGAGEYKTRSEVSLNLNTQNEKAQPVKGELSLSVFLLDSLQTADQQTIDSYLWLASDLNGTIESPAYYFSDSSAEVNRAIDDLLLTHGWRRFRWEDVKSKPVFNFLPEYEGLTIHAKVVDKQSGAPGRGIVSYLSVADENFQASNAVSNEKGEARFVMGNVFGPNELVAQTDSNSNRYRIELQDPFAGKPDALVLPRFNLTDKWKEQLNLHHLNARISNSYQP
ncbi:MAG: hypothetical protein WCF67_09565, partial [Chitinophagaceae bacterium]